MALVFSIATPPIDNLMVAISSFITAYAILRHQLMGIEVIVKRTLVFAGLLASVFAMLILPTLLIQEYILRSAGFGGRMIGLTISGIIIILTMRHIETFFINVTDRYLFQKKYDYKELLKTFTAEVLTVLDMNRLIDLTVEKLTNIIRLDSCAVNLENTRKIDITKSYIINEKGELAIPMVLHGNLIGILSLGRKKSDEGYTQDDLDILLPLARTLAIAISNAKLFIELGKTQAEAAQKEKMATIGTLAAGMAHEIRNPITTIRTFADYLPERFRNQEFIDTFNRLIPKEIDRVEDIARSLLEFSYMDSTDKKENFDVADTIKTILSLLGPQYKFSDIHISYDIGGRTDIHANKGQIQEALFNIMKYVVSETPKNSNLLIGIKENGAELLVAIKDNDMITADYIIKDVFEPVSALYRTKRGFGFTLFIAKQLIEKNGGAFSISSSMDTGTDFIISLKRVSARHS